MHKSLEITTLLPSEAAQEVYDTAVANRDVTENSRRLAPSLVSHLADTGLFRMGLPKFLGGWEDNPVEVLKAYELISSAEAAAGWSVWNNHLACTFGRFLDEDSMREIYKNPSHVYANSARPEGVAEIVPGGYNINGRWTLVSGSEISDWFALRCLVTGDGLPKTLGPGAKLKLFFIPKAAVKVIDTWHVGGLRGTGSHDIKVENHFVQEAYAVDFESPVAIDNAYSRLPIGCYNSAGNAAIALGIFKAAMDDLIKICFERITPGKNPDLRDRDRIQSIVAKSKAMYKSMRGQLHDSMSVIWEESIKGNYYSDEQLADVWSSSVQAAETSRTMVSEIYAAAGTVSLYTENMIERAHRDVHAVLQHGIIQPHWMNQAGMAYLGIKPKGAMFRI